MRSRSRSVVDALPSKITAYDTGSDNGVGCGTDTTSCLCCSSRSFQRSSSPLLSIANDLGSLRDLDRERIDTMPDCLQVGHWRALGDQHGPAGVGGEDHAAGDELFPRRELFLGEHRGSAPMANVG